MKKHSTKKSTALGALFCFIAAFAVFLIMTIITIFTNILFSDTALAQTELYRIIKRGVFPLIQIGVPIMLIISSVILLFVAAFSD